jgi:hypothetical protein
MLSLNSFKDMVPPDHDARSPALARRWWQQWQRRRRWECSELYLHSAFSSVLAAVDSTSGPSYDMPMENWIQ